MKVTSMKAVKTLVLGAVAVFALVIGDNFSVSEAEAGSGSFKSSGFSRSTSYKSFSKSKVYRPAKTKIIKTKPRVVAKTVKPVAKPVQTVSKRNYVTNNSNSFGTDMLTGAMLGATAVMLLNEPDAQAQESQVLVNEHVATPENVTTTELSSDSVVTDYPKYEQERSFCMTPVSMLPVLGMIGMLVFLTRRKT